MPPDRGVTAQTYARGVAQYVEATGSFDPFPGLRDEVEAYGRTCVNETLLEIGVGSGRDFELLSRHTERSLALDACSGFLIRLRQSDRVCGEAQQLPLRAESFSRIWCYAVLLHLTSDEVSLALTEIRRVLVVNGTAALSVKTGEPMSGLRQSGIGERWLSVFSEQDFLDQVESSGLRVERAWTRGLRENVWLSVWARRD